MPSTPDPMWASRENGLHLLRKARSRCVRVLDGATVGTSRAELVDQAKVLARRAQYHGVMVGDEDLADFAARGRELVEAGELAEFVDLTADLVDEE